jgi:hypothetical protein
LTDLAHDTSPALWLPEKAFSTKGLPLISQIRGRVETSTPFAKKSITACQFIVFVELKKH